MCGCCDALRCYVITSQSTRDILLCCALILLLNRTLIAFPNLGLSEIYYFRIILFLLLFRTTFKAFREDDSLVNNEWVYCHWHKHTLTSIPTSSSFKRWWSTERYIRLSGPSSGVEGLRIYTASHSLAFLTSPSEYKFYLYDTIRMYHHVYNSN